MFGCRSFVLSNKIKQTKKIILGEQRSNLPAINPNTSAPDELYEEPIEHASPQYIAGENINPKPAMSPIRAGYDNQQKLGFQPNSIERATSNEGEEEKETQGY